MRAPWLPDVLRDEGLPVRVLPGWRGRGRDMATIYGVVVHDTVTPSSAWNNARVDQLLRDGGADLPGPLSQLGLDFEARLVVIADGRSNHNGYGTWGNNAIGIETYCAGGLRGREEPWSEEQREVAARGSAAILRHLDLGRSAHWNPRVAGHKETDPRRKIDPWQIVMDEFRRDVQRLIDTPASKPVSPPSQKEDDIVASLPILRRRTDLGRESDDDRRVQGLLAAAGVLDLSPVNIRAGRPDGKFGPSTERAVRTFQSRAGLSVDGVVGEDTWRALLGVR